MFVQINEKFAIDLLAEEPVVAVKGNHTWCDGGQLYVTFCAFLLWLLTYFVLGEVKHCFLSLCNFFYFCSQGHAELGHPKVYINLDKPEINVCGYCGKRFVSEEHKNLFPEEKFSSPDL